MGLQVLLVQVVQLPDSLPEAGRVILGIFAVFTSSPGFLAFRIDLGLSIGLKLETVLSLNCMFSFKHAGFRIQYMLSVNHLFETCLFLRSAWI